MEASARLGWGFNCMRSLCLRRLPRRSLLPARLRPMRVRIHQAGGLAEPYELVDVGPFPPCLLVDVEGEEVVGCQPGKDWPFLAGRRGCVLCFLDRIKLLHSRAYFRNQPSGWT